MIAVVVGSLGCTVSLMIFVQPIGVSKIETAYIKSPQLPQIPSSTALGEWVWVCECSQFPIQMRIEMAFSRSFYGSRI